MKLIYDGQDWPTSAPEGYPTECAPYKQVCQSSAISRASGIRWAFGCSLYKGHEGVHVALNGIDPHPLLVWTDEL